MPTKTMSYIQPVSDFDGNGLLSYGGGKPEGTWSMDAELQRARQFRRGSQPALYQNGRRDSIITQEPMQSHYRRNSVARESFQNYRRDSLTTERPLGSYRRDSITRGPTQNFSPTKPESTSRRGSDADDISWIAKYQKSDHHTDRLVQSKLDHEKTFGILSTGQSNEAASHLNRRRSRFGSVQPSDQTSHNPFRYEGTNKITVYLKPPRSYSTQTSQPDRSINQLLTSTSTGIDYGRSSSSSAAAAAAAAAAATSTIASRPSLSSSVGSGAFRRSSISSLPSTSATYRRNSVDSSLSRALRPSSFSNRVDVKVVSPVTQGGPVSTASFIESQVPYRPSFARAPSVPPTWPVSMSQGAQSIAAEGSSGWTRVPVELLARDVARHRRSSIAYVPDLSTAKYHRIVDFGSNKSASESFRSPVSFRRRLSYDTLSPLSSVSPVSPLSPQSPLSCLSLPPPSERIFGARNTHSSLRRNRRSVVDG